MWIDAIIDDAKASAVPEIKGLGRILKQWRDAILAWHTTGAASGPTEGLNSRPSGRSNEYPPPGFTNFVHFDPAKIAKSPTMPRMASYLVVANQTLGGTALTQVVTERATIEAATFHVVVPATEPADEHPPVAGTASENAYRRLHEALERLEAAGVRATGELGAADPMQAIRDALTAHSYSGLIISTLPSGISGWVRMDLPHRAAREFNVLVEWIEARTDAPNEATISRIDAGRTAMQNLESPGTF